MAQMNIQLSLCRQLLKTKLRFSQSIQNVSFWMNIFRTGEKSSSSCLSSTRIRHTSKKIKQRLEHLRGELRAERISYGELAELQDLAPHIEDGDVELLEAAGVPEEEARREGRC